MVRPTKNISRALEQEWYSDGSDPFKRIRHILNCTESRNNDEEQPIVIPDDVPVPQMSKVYGYNNKTKTWEHLGNKCHDCGKPLREGRVTEKHPLICKRTLKINKDKEEVNMPIQRIMKNGEPYYRWGDHGKLYKNRQDAEKQAQAAYAAGYKEPMKKVNK
jgi:hypothetical protein